MVRFFITRWLHDSIESVNSTSILRTTHLLSIHSGGAMKYGCYLYNFDLTYWFDTKAQAEEYGLRSGFQYTVVEIYEDELGYN
jgi:hypothetical protein